MLHPSILGSQVSHAQSAVQIGMDEMIILVNRIRRRAGHYSMQYTSHSNAKRTFRKPIDAMRLSILLSLMLVLFGCTHLGNRSGEPLEELNQGSWLLASVYPGLNVKTLTSNTFYPDHTWDASYFNSTDARFEPEDFDGDERRRTHPEEMAKYVQDRLLQRKARTWKLDGNIVYLYRVVAGVPQLDHSFRVSSYGYGPARLCSQRDCPRKSGQLLPYIRVSGSKSGAASLWYRAVPASSFN